VGVSPQAQQFAQFLENVRAKSLPGLVLMPEGQHSFILGAGRVPEVDQAVEQMVSGSAAISAPEQNNCSPPSAHRRLWATRGTPSIHQEKP
jgi:hypothetical protein